MKYTCHWSTDHQPPAPLVDTVIDKKLYVHVDELRPGRKQAFLQGAEQLNPAYADALQNDDFLNALRREFNASAVVPKVSFDRAIAAAEDSKV